MSKKVALILSGCGGLDGAEIQEAVCSILAIEERGFTWKAFSLDEHKKRVVSALTMKEVNEKRNMMAEAARITHGQINNIKNLKADDFDVLWFPGGYGVVTSFSDFAEKKESGVVHKEIEKVIKDFFLKKKAIVALCIAPSLLAKVLENKKIHLTLGQSLEHHPVLEKLGQMPKQISSEDILFDEKNNIYTSPAYMNQDANCYKIYTACKKIANSIADD